MSDATDIAASPPDPRQRVGDEGATAGAAAGPAEGPGGPGDPPEAADGGAGQPRAGRPERLRGVAGSIWVLEHAQDVLAIVVGVMLVLLAGTLIVSGLVGFLHTSQTQTITAAATALLDRILLVLILVEIVHTVVLSLREHQLAAQPFIVVGLVAVIRRILFLMSNEVKINATELGLLIAMVIAFVAGLIAVRYVDHKVE